MRINFSILTLFVLVFSTLTASAQIKTPQLSPVAKITQEVGVSEVSVEYSRPSARGRKVFGDLLPYGEMWRTGANASTKITFKDNISIKGQKLDAGSYALYTVPGEKEWAVVFYKNTKFWGTPGKEYDGNDEALRLLIPVTMLGANVETFTIGFDNLTNAKYDINMDWERTRITLPIDLNTDEKVMADIKKTLEGPDGRAYYSAAQYYFQEGKNMQEALAFCETALQKGGEKFWMLRLKSQILAKLGKYTDAIAVAEKSSEVATKEGNADYPRMNAKSIEEWKKMK
jgi:Protein of unknown function (DUF2911)